MTIVLIVSLAVALASLFAGVYVLTSHSELASSSRVSFTHLPEGHNAIVEPFFLVLEHKLAHLLRALRNKFLLMFVAMLDRFVPWFRRATRNFEARLVGIIRTVKGKREVNSRGRGAASSHIQNIRNHHDEVMKGGGSIEG